MRLQTPASRVELRKDFRAALGRNDDVLLRVSKPRDQVTEFAARVVRAMERRPRKLDCRFLYDERGSALYQRITRQPEYYPTRTEAAILRRHASDIRAITGEVTLVELGSGSSEKTDLILAAHLEEDEEVCYVPVDVSESALWQAGDVLSRRRPDTTVVGLAGTYDDALPLIPEASPVMVIFLGSTIGNLDLHEEDVFWTRMWELMPAGDYFLLGVDLRKDRGLLHDAYNDAAGVTAEFTKNIFVRMNRQLDAGLDLATIQHEAAWSEAESRIEIHARFDAPQTLDVRPLGRSFDIEAGERVLVEISRKFRIDERTTYLEACGFNVREVFTDDRGWFAVMLLRKMRSRAIRGI